MRPDTESDRRPARLVYGAVIILLTLLISVVFIKHFDGQDQSAVAANGKDLTHSGAQNGPAAAPASTAAPAASASAAAASAAQEPPNPFKAFAAHGRGAAPAPASAPASAATEPVDPFKAFLESGQAAAPAPPAEAQAGQEPPDAQGPATDPFKEALERQQQQQQQQR
jgi:hypothetical protein